MHLVPPAICTKYEEGIIVCKVFDATEKITNQCTLKIKDMEYSCVRIRRYVIHEARKRTYKNQDLYSSQQISFVSIERKCPCLVMSCQVRSQYFQYNTFYLILFFIKKIGPCNLLIPMSKQQTVNADELPSRMSCFENFLQFETVLSLYNTIGILWMSNNVGDGETETERYRLRDRLTKR